MGTADVFNMNGLTTFALGDGLKAEKDEFGRVTITTSKKGDVYSKAEVDQKIETIELTPGPQGPKGDKGDKGDPGEDGKDGKSAYQGAVEQGYQGSEAQFYKELGGLTKAVSTANEAAQDAENAKSGAENAKGGADASATAAAGSASVASASAEAAARYADDVVDAKLAAEKSATAANTAVKDAQAAKTAAETAKTQAEAARDAANTAKTGAEKAKQDAEAAKSAAATSASQAATSATNAAQSATQAQEAAEGLQEGLETLEGIDGRVTFLETGEGVYKDPATGKVVTFTPLPESDGTIKVIKDLPNFVKVTPMEEDASKTCVATSDGVYYVLGVDDHLYFYDASLNRLGPCWKSNYCRMDWSRFSTSSGRYALWEDEATGHVMCATQDNNNATSGKIYLYDVTAGAVLKSVNKPEASLFYNNETIYNAASGHLLTRGEAPTLEDGTKDYHWLLWDTDLNPILAEDGTQKRVDANHVFYGEGQASTGKLFDKTPVRVMQMAADRKTLISSINRHDWGDRGGNVGLFTFDENDTCIQIMEVKPVEDPENPGYCQCVKDAEGNIEREWTDDRNCYFPRLVYEELGPATFKKAYPAEYGLSAGGNGNGVSGLPFVSPVWNSFVKGFNSVLRDNCFTYILTRDNKLVNTVFIGNWFAAETSAPKYTYQLPVPNAAQYGKLKWPSGASNIYIFHISTRGNGATGIMLYPVTNSGADYCNVMVRGNGGGDASNPFVPDREQKATFSPLTFTLYACASASKNSNVFFGVPCWFTTVNRAFAGVL